MTSKLRQLKTGLALSIFCVCLCFQLAAETQLAGIFANHMVLQRNTEINIWGTDLPGQSIRIMATWGAGATAETDPQGNWRLQLSTPEAGGPYTIEIQGSSNLELSDVLIGEVWLCSGQSNMEMPVKGYRNQPVLGSNEARLQSIADEIRLFHFPHNAQLEPKDSIKGRWLVSSPAKVGDFSATAYFFAKKLQEALGVPIGLVHSSWGGSSAEAWTDRETLLTYDPEIKIPTEMPDRVVFQAPSVLYNGMIHPLIGYTIRGAIWYQGEANIGRYRTYAQLITDMVTSWREKWGQGDFPFYFVQIAPYGYQDGHPTALQREAQAATVDSLPNSGMAVTMDIGDCRNIHPADKQTVGNRLAYIALAKTYGINGIAYSGPVYRSMEVTEDKKIKVYFDQTENGLSSFGRELSGFRIAGSDRVFKEAQVRINRDDSITVWSDEVPNPVAVRYAFESCSEGTLFNNAQLPASSFRMDSWE
ncbi:sialate O-acetylesterase [Flavilitoribacter nigricans]|uniref:Sialate O-acetylesterase n=1 Tax=Flavilitoribacter nigricans (strain ATCC 23147 / DSM 23189 / NBRC 102662 / NCIMB 1420 / SS-2) TaxID=1122177 RepID=A0A2D0N8W2_FLAN2|nr:sialate O-acetylesterase [Flavilitoribacter nigricans]PHN04589.1 sialate O-acetylesterase [Flavilitoribacter nigricans DSM 23189 = NBRC 102662]